MMRLLALLAAAAAVALLFNRLHLPGGLVIGAMIGAAGYTLATGGPEVDVPAPLSSAALVVLGASIGAGITRATLADLRAVLLPALLAAVLIILAGIGIYFLLRAFGIAPAGALLATSPGALTALTAAAAERGAGAAEVALFHTVRIVLVLLSLPGLIALLPDEGG